MKCELAEEGKCLKKVWYRVELRQLKNGPAILVCGRHLEKVLRKKPTVIVGRYYDYDGDYD